MASKKDFNDLIKQAEAEGWDVAKGRGSGHLHWKSPVCGHKVFSAKTPSDGRALNNHLSLMRQHGWNPEKVATCPRAR